MEPVALSHRVRSHGAIAVIRRSQTPSVHPIMRKLIDNGRAWVKLSGPYINNTSSDYAPATEVAKAFVAAAPERMVWGSDWPHPTETQKPDDAVLFDLLHPLGTGCSHTTSYSG